MKNQKLKNLVGGGSGSSKYLAIAGVLLVVVLAGALAYQNFFPAEPEAPVVEQPEALSDWKTYRNEEYGFEFKYSQKLVLETGNTSDVFGVGLYLNDGKIFSDRVFGLSIYASGGMGGHVCMYAIEGFSEKMSIDGEQASFCRQLNQKGGEPSYFPTAWIERGAKTYIFMGEGSGFDQILSTFRFLD